MQAPAAAAVPVTESTDVEPTPETTPEVVTLSQEYATAVARLQRGQNLLIAAELRVQNLKDSITNFKAAADDAKRRLTDLLSIKEPAGKHAVRGINLGGRL